jgi:hypothetical protein
MAHLLLLVEDGVDARLVRGQVLRKPLGVR